MKNNLIWINLFFVLILISGCSTTSPTPQKTDTQLNSVKTAFTPQEKQMYLSAITHLNNGEYEAAENGLTKLAQVHPNQPGVLLNLAQTYYKRS